MIDSINKLIEYFIQLYIPIISDFPLGIVLVKLSIIIVILLSVGLISYGLTKILVDLSIKKIKEIKNDN